MNLLKIFLILYQVQERTGRESKVQVLKFALIVFHANLAIIIYISKWTRICNLDSYLIFFFFFQHQEAHLLLILTSTVLFPQLHLEEVCLMIHVHDSVLKPSGLPSWSLSLFSYFEMTRSITCSSGQDASVLQGYPPAFHQASLKIYPYPFLLYVHSKIYTLKMCKIVEMHKS